jgi:hypothetical protein
MNNTSTITTNKNPLGVSDGFRMVFKKAPNTSYFCQNFIMPGVTTNEVTVQRPQISAFFPGDKIEYEPLTVTMLLAENMENYSEIYNWMISSVKSNQSSDKFDDILVYILSSKNNPNAIVTFKNAFPTNIGSISFSIQESDIVYAQVDVTFRYDYFTFESLAESTTRP